MSAATLPEPRSTLDELRVPPDSSAAERTVDDFGGAPESTGSVPWSPNGAQARTALLARIAAPVDAEVTQLPRPEAIVELRARVLAEAPEVLPAARGPLAAGRAYGPYAAPRWTAPWDEAAPGDDRTASLSASLEVTGEMVTDRGSAPFGAADAAHVRGRRRLGLMVAAALGLLLMGGLTRACGGRSMPAEDAGSVPQGAEGVDADGR